MSVLEQHPCPNFHCEHPNLHLVCPTCLACMVLVCSLDIASEVTSREVGLPKEDNSTLDDNYGGVDTLARAIQHSEAVHVHVGNGKDLGCHQMVQ